jgi:hypothetical protein
MTGPEPNQELVVVFESANPITFDVAKSALEEAGIQFAVLDEGRIGFGVTPIVNPVYRIQVVQSCEKQALELMKDVLGTVDS